MNEKRTANDRLREKVGETIRASREMTGAIRDALRPSTSAPSAAPLALRPELRRAMDALLAGGAAQASARDHVHRELLFLAGCAALGGGTLTIRDASLLPAQERARVGGTPWVVMRD